MSGKITPSIAISDRKLEIGKSYSSGISGATIIPETNKRMAQDCIKFRNRSNQHYGKNQALYFNYLDENWVVTKVDKVV
ncbi:hypothetical protein EAb13_CDS0018 [Acinetobacter phage EAb13]|nr:hypothetical protein EAb13_CDS0018 [Acinetobacter phage EAb13]